MQTIDLGQYRGSASKVFSGREEGKQLRKTLKLDEVDISSEPILLIIPPDTYSMTSGFFLGLFGNSIRFLGEEKFKEQYQFQCSDVIRETINEDIKRALKTSNPLG